MTDTPTHTPLWGRVESALRLAGGEVEAFRMIAADIEALQARNSREREVIVSWLLDYAQRLTTDAAFTEAAAPHIDLAEQADKRREVISALRTRAEAVAQYLARGTLP
jgi:hypothetical protein